MPPAALPPTVLLAAALPSIALLVMAVPPASLPPTALPSAVTEFDDGDKFRFAAVAEGLLVAGPHGGPGEAG